MRTLHKETTISSPIERAWWAWTTSEGIAAWWAKSSWIELRIGGAFELYFLLNRPRGSQGSEGCRILSYRPPDMLSFSWNFPPSIPELREERTWVVLNLASEEPGVTQVSLDQLGWKEGPAWESGWKSLDDAWEQVLEAFRTRFPAAEAAGKVG
ncbi:MAG TPA: SRPBCC domain-containing protein [Thermoplasmata archaeon]|nr:SRPBCC domain-containing protein [Thermoplasmata archaeon]